MNSKKTIKQYRSLLGMNQKDFAKAIKMKHSTYQTKESGKRDWKAFELKQISNFLKVSMNEIDF